MTRHQQQVVTKFCLGASCKKSNQLHLKKLKRNVFQLLQSTSRFIVHNSHKVQTNNNNNNNNNYHSSFQFNKLYNTIHTNVIHIFRVLTQTKRPVINQQPPFTGILVHEERNELHDGDHPCRWKVTCLLNRIQSDARYCDAL